MSSGRLEEALVRRHVVNERGELFCAGMAAVAPRCFCSVDRAADDSPGSSFGNKFAVEGTTTDTACVDHATLQRRARCGYFQTSEAVHTHRTAYHAVRTGATQCRARVRKRTNALAIVDESKTPWWRLVVV